MYVIQYSNWQILVRSTVVIITVGTQLVALGYRIYTLHTSQSNNTNNQCKYLLILIFNSNNNNNG